VRLDALVGELDAYFRVPDVRGEFAFVEQIYPPYWRELVEPAYVGRWNGLMVRGRSTVRRAVTCVFPSGEIVASLEPETLLFSEHPVDLEDEPGFQPLSRESLERLRETASGFYHVHGPLDQHPEIAPSRLVAEAIGLDALEEFCPIVEGLDGGAIVAGASDLTIDALADRLAAELGPEVPVRVVSRPRSEAGKVAVAAGGGADVEFLRPALERGCQTYVTGNAITSCRLDFVREGVSAFLELAETEGAAVVDGTHYGLEKPPQVAMVEWFRRKGVPAEFRAVGPK
jgi:putative NIF3 family GTP cyclohydrolase 1 type 2